MDLEHERQLQSLWLEADELAKFYNTLKAGKDFCGPIR